MRVLFWGTYDTSKPRPRILRAGLRSVGIDVDEIHVDVWSSVEDKSQLKGFWQRLRIAARWIWAYPRLALQLARAPRPDLLLVGYPGVVDVFIATFIARLRKIPVAWDVFMSLYDTIVEDRQMLSHRGLVARALHALEARALRRVDLAFLDTSAHARRIESLFGLPAQTCGAVWVGVETEHFAPTATSDRSGAPLQVLFYGQFIPLHGIGTIIEAARILREAPVAWTLIGRGQEAEKIRAMLAADPLPKVQWIEWVDYRSLQERIASADLCLGIFGESGKAASVIPNKVFQIVAMGRPLVTRDSPAIRELLRPEQGCVYLVQPGDAQSLADAIRNHQDFTGWKQARACHVGAQRLINARAVGEQFLKLVHRSRPGAG